MTSDVPPKKTRSPFPWRRLVTIVICGVILVYAIPLLVRSYGSWLDRDDHGALEGHRKNAPYITSPQDVVDRMLELGQVDKDDLVYDLGCGDGRIVITAAKRFGCRGIGYEYDPQLVALAQEKARQAGVDHLVTIYEKDIFAIDHDELNQATVITLYLLDWMNTKLIPQLEKLSPGKMIVSHDWGLVGIEPEHSEHMDSKDDDLPVTHTINVWSTPLRK